MHLANHQQSTTRSKGLVERANGFLETSFLPGRTFGSPADFNTQLAQWTAMVNQRHRRVLGCAPADRIQADRAAMLPLPPVAPQTGWRASLRLPRDHYMRLDGNDYSVHPGVIGRRVELSADLERVQVRCEGLLVADHARCWARHQTLTDPAHLDAAHQLRRRRLQVTRHQPVQLELEVEQRRLADYDQAFGLAPPDGQGVA